MAVPASLQPADVRVTSWMARHGVKLARWSLGVIYLWFGALKLVPGLSPAEDLATRTLGVLSGGLLGPEASLVVLGVWETAIGLGLLARRCLRITLWLLFLQLCGTFLPLAFFPGETFHVMPVAPTLEGQYIIKNLVLVSAAIVVGATVRGGQLSPRPVANAPRDTV